MAPWFQGVHVVVEATRNDFSRSRTLDVEQGKVVKFLKLDVIGDQEAFEVLAQDWPTIPVKLEQKNLIECINKDVGNDVGVFGEKKRGRKASRCQLLHVSARHAVQKRDPVVAADPHDNTVVNLSQACSAMYRFVLQLKRCRRGSCTE
jgi:hypothetical protein